MSLLRGIVLGTLLLGGGPHAAETKAESPMIPDLPWEKRSDWIDVKTDVTPRATGDGIADDTACAY